MLKTLQNPPEGIKLVLEAVCLLLDIKPIRIPDPELPAKFVYDFWPVSKKLLSDLHFIDILRRYDKDHIPNEIIAKIRTGYFLNYKIHSIS